METQMTVNMDILFGDNPASARNELAKLMLEVAKHHDWAYVRTSAFRKCGNGDDGASVTTQDEHDAPFVHGYALTEESEK